MFNDRAGLILNLKSQLALGKHYRKVFHTRPQVGLSELLHNTQVEHEHGTIVPHSVVCPIPGRRGLVYLNVYVTSLRDTQGMPIGLALVVDDRTELKRKETEAKEIRACSHAMCIPGSWSSSSKSASAQARWRTKEITVVFADIRGYTRLSENVTPEEAMNLLNAYLKLMVEKIWEEERDHHRISG